MSDEYTIYYLELTQDQFSGRKNRPREGVEILPSSHKVGALNEYFYRWVGASWDWSDKLEWKAEQWQAYATTVDLFILYVDGTPAGFFELKGSGEQCSLEYFGIGDAFLEQRLGGYMLGEALHIALNRGAKVIVNTCTLDHPHALGNYQSRGMKVVKTEVKSTLS